MCGIAGFTAITPTKRAGLRLMEMLISTRGKDSWGLTNGYKVIKKLGNIEETGTFDLPEWVLDNDVVLVHTRGASANNVTTPNSHPFLVKGPTKTVLGVHNGCLYDWQKLVDKYKMPKYPVDSNALYHMLAYDYPTEEITGWGALVWFEWPNDDPEAKSLNFARFNMDDLHIWSTPDGELMWASTEHTIKSALMFMGVQFSDCLRYNIKPDFHYQYNPPGEGDEERGQILLGLGAMKFGSRFQQTQVQTPTMGFGNDWQAGVYGAGSRRYTSEFYRTHHWDMDTQSYLPNEEDNGGNSHPPNVENPHAAKNEPAGVNGDARPGQPAGTNGAGYPGPRPGARGFFHSNELPAVCPVCCKGSFNNADEIICAACADYVEEDWKESTVKASEMQIIAQETDFDYEVSKTDVSGALRRIRLFAYRVTQLEARRKKRELLKIEKEKREAEKALTVVEKAKAIVADMIAEVSQPSQASLIETVLSNEGV